jgi:ATP-binding cassette subfamily C (CFTR/MRP) protein 1
MLKEKTVVSVLHRLETAVKYDKILVLDEGKVVDFGTPDAVIQRCELFGAFRRQGNGGGEELGESSECI